MNKFLSLQHITDLLPQWAKELGFQQIGVCDLDLSAEQPRLDAWLEKKFHGQMSWMAQHRELRLNPEQLQPGCVRVISARMNYLPQNKSMIETLKREDKAYISRYALGRDYHKLMRKRLATLAQKIKAATAPLMSAEQRPFVDSAPILERPLAAKAGLGWVGKHTLLLNEQAGSYFFLGEILTNLPLPINTSPVENRCGECQACLKVCPTDAFTQAYQLDARRCISYLTIENKDAIPLEFREAMGNRVFGCDDCQIICPWNKTAPSSNEGDFQARHGLDNADLLELFLWDEPTFLKNTAGSAIRRIGYQNWLRNLAIGLGNAPYNEQIVAALEARREQASALLQEHIDWAIERQRSPRRRRRKIRNGEIT